jgi:L-2-hydroxyglutarate oxidase
MNSGVIVGGGIVGLATALALRRRFPAAGLAVLEKEADCGRHQSTHNSGVLHCGLYYKPGSLKARLAVTGIRRMVDFCRAHEIPHDICGKLVVATNDLERTRLDDLMARGTANGLSGLCRLDGDGLRRIEPHAAGIAAIHVPEEGIVDYAAVIQTMVLELQRQDVSIVTGAKVTAINRRGAEWRCRTPVGEYVAEWLINCAGLHCDRIAQLAGAKEDTRIVPFRGEYYQLRPDAATLCRHLIYPVPDPAFPFLGVHFTRLIGGGVEAGPNAVPAFAREGYTLGTVNLRDLMETLSFPGLWRFAKRYPSMAWAEFRQSLSRERFCKALQKLIPEIRPEHLAPGGAGVRAQAMTPAGDLIQDFHIVRGENALHVLNAPSPAATASLAIGEYVAEQTV